MTFKLQPNEFGADTADDPPALRAFREFIADLCESDLNPSGKVRLRVEMGPAEYAALRRHFQRPFKPKPSSFVMSVSEAGKHYGMVEFVRKDDASNATQPPQSGETTVA